MTRDCNTMFHYVLTTRLTNSVANQRVPSAVARDSRGVVDVHVFEPSASERWNRDRQTTPERERRAGEGEIHPRVGHRLDFRIHGEHRIAVVKHHLVFECLTFDV